WSFEHRWVNPASRAVRVNAARSGNAASWRKLRIGRWAPNSMGGDCSTMSHAPERAVSEPCVNATCYSGLSGACTLGAMAKDETFDITTGCDLQEVANAVNQAQKEISTRFDFKGVLADIQYEHGSTKLTLHAEDDYKLEAMWQVLTGQIGRAHV